jgi:5-methyltetrahydrofolate--homocysteine methyltransferase
VKGDLHDIGKNLVAMLAEGAGFRVVDLGTDVPAARFVEAARAHQARLCGISALLTTTMAAMRGVVQEFERAGLRSDVKLCVGGAPTSAAWAREIGADGHARDAASAAVLFSQLLAPSQPGRRAP